MSGFHAPLIGTQPGIYPHVETNESEVTWGYWTVNGSYVMSMVIKGDSEDRGTTRPGELRPGLALSWDDTAKKAYPWLGGQNIFGFLPYDLILDGANDKNYPVIVAGQIQTKAVIFQDHQQTNYDYGNLAGHTDEAVIRAELEKRFILDDFAGSLGAIGTTPV